LTKTSIAPYGHAPCWKDEPSAALITEAIRGYLGRPEARRTSSLRLLRPEACPPGNDRLSMEIDQIVYGNQR
jgi:hypothetical protein